jgi:hypothetical protein
MDACDAGDLARCLRHPIELVDRHTEVDDAHEDHEEDDDRHRELDEALASFSRSPGCHGTGTDFVTVTEQLPNVAVTPTSWDPPDVKFTVTLDLSIGPTPVKAPDHAKFQPGDVGNNVASRSIRWGLPGFALFVHVKSIVGHAGGGVEVGPEPVTVIVAFELPV